eukprot:273244-Pelagomonas_calceolata.AAC.2
MVQSTAAAQVQRVWCRAQRLHKCRAYGAEHSGCTSAERMVQSTAAAQVQSVWCRAQWLHKCRAYGAEHGSCMSAEQA